MSANKLRSMAGLENHEFLESINLEDNEVRNVFHMGIILLSISSSMIYLIRIDK